jgi:hypothetical protein
VRVATARHQDDAGAGGQIIGIGEPQPGHREYGPQHAGADHHLKEVLGVFFHDERGDGQKGDHQYQAHHLNDHDHGHRQHGDEQEIKPCDRNTANARKLLIV